MDKDLASGSLGNVGSYDVAFKSGKLVVSGSVALPPGESVSLELQVDSGKVIDALAAAIPGKIDDVLLAMIKNLLNA